jgi:hypothetical protein
MKNLKVFVCLLAAMAAAQVVRANHPVLVEGNCNVPPAGSATAPLPATCGDWDGDGMIGTAEDTDGDRVFGTITAALGSAGINQNGSITIVTSGTFPEVLNITAANGNVTLQGAPGVEANIDAVLQGDSGNGARQNAPGIVVNSPASRIVILRNLTSRNWSEGIRIGGDSRAQLEHVRIENNRDFGLRIMSRARVQIDETQVLASGFRSGAAPVVNTANPGHGIAVLDDAQAAIFRSTVSGTLGTAILNSTGAKSNVRLLDIFLFDNGKDLEGAIYPPGFAAAFN